MINCSWNVGWKVEFCFEKTEIFNYMFKSSDKSLALSFLKLTILVDNVLVLDQYMYMYVQIHEDTCCPDAGSCMVQSIGIRDRFFSYLEGTTKASSCCWLCISPAETLYSPYTAASLIGRPPVCYTFLMKPVISFQKCCVFCDLPLVICLTFPSLLYIMEYSKYLSTGTEYELLNRSLCSSQ